MYPWAREAVVRAVCAARSATAESDASFPRRSRTHGVTAAAREVPRRLAVYFPDAATAVQWLVLASWLVVGVVLALIGHRRDAAELTPPAEQLDASPSSASASASASAPEPVAVS